MYICICIDVYEHICIHLDIYVHMNKYIYIHIGAQGPGWVVSDRPRSAAVTNNSTGRIGSTAVPAGNNTLSYDGYMRSNK
jgi:hypothetical protein